MTVKTLLIALMLVVGFAGFMSVAWDISAWMMGMSVAEVEPAQPKAPPAEKTQTGVPDQSQSTAIKPVQENKADHKQPAQSGAYDDSWTGSEETKASVVLKPSSQVQKKSAAPVTAKQPADPYAPDDREAGGEPEQTGSTSPPLNKADPYKGDDREAQ